MSKTCGELSRTHQTMNPKEELRLKFLQIRDSLKNREEKSQKIVERILHSSNFLLSKNILFYIPVGSEVNITPLIQYAFENDKNVFIPFIDTQQFGQIHSFDDLIAYKKNTQFKVPSKISKEKLDLAIVPGLAFDNQKFRLGSGKGWYDRFLKRNILYSIGVTYKKCITASLPTEEFDIPVNQLITD